ncbi:hypothetical protein C8R46DRAFT_1077343 [Mycena filopes]|nr:hypothetical protein C8R46DRAFT_1077343 [Mycena filopes]
MSLKTHTWISAWFLVTLPIILWDIGYCFLRPRSMEGGDLNWFWAPYALYQKIDLVYGIPALERGDGFPNAQSLLNIFELILNILYVYTAHITQWPPAPLLGFAGATMTLSKTVLYWAQEYYCNFCAVGHNTIPVLIQYWIIPGGLWIVVPALIVRTLWKDLAADLILAHKVSTKAASGKGT